MTSGELVASGRLSRLRVPDGQVRAVALVMHGGRARSTAAARPWQLAAVRMWPFAGALWTGGRTRGLAVGMVRYRYRGWNDDAQDPVADAEQALQAVTDRWPERPVALVGHSMGGRAALLAAGRPGVRSVAALAPWLSDADPVAQLTGRTVLIAHGDRERMTDPTASYDYAQRAKAVTPDVCRFDVRGDGHAMLRRAADWHRLVTRFTLAALDLEPMPEAIANALRAPVPRGLAVALPR